MSDQSTTPPDGDEPDTSGFDRLARKVGDEMRRPAPEGGARIVEQRRTRQLRTRALVGGGAGALLLVAILGWAATRKDDDAAVVDEPQAVTTVAEVAGSAGDSPRTTADSSAAATSAASTIATSTTATPTTVASTTTTEPVAAEIEFAIDYTAGPGGTTSGEPVRIGYASDAMWIWEDYAAAAAVELVNNELGGVGGRPVELLRCDITGPGGAASCGEQFANDPLTRAVLVGELPDASLFEAVGPSMPVLVGAAFDPNLNGFSDRAVLPYLDLVTTQLGMLKFAVEELLKGPGVIGWLGTGGEGASGYNPALPDGVTIVGVNLDNDTPEKLAAKITAAGAERADVYLVFRPAGGAPGQDECASVPEALDLLGIDRPVIAQNCAYAQPMRQRLADRGVGGDAPEGWYVATDGFSPADPTIESGFATYHSAMERYVTATDASGAEWDDLAARNFGNLLTLVKLLNESGGAEADRASVYDALRNLEGPVFLSASPHACGEVTYPSPVEALGFIQPGAACATHIGIHRYVGGEWESIADGNNGQPYDARF